MTTQDDIPLLIRAMRRRVGLTQEKLAAKLGVTFPTVNRWEHGRTRPSPLAILRIKELVSSLGNRGMDLSERIESPRWSPEDETQSPGYRPKIVFVDSWPVLEQGTD